MHFASQEVFSLILHREAFGNKALTYFGGSGNAIIAVIVGLADFYLAINEFML